MKDDLGDRMKAYEKSSKHVLDGDYIGIRVDGKAFHTLTKKYEKPYDERIAFSMQKAAKKLMEETHAMACYVQSDEISLILNRANSNSQQYYGGNIQKLASVTASMASVEFYRAMSTFSHPSPLEELSPYFDSRIWELPSEIESANYLLWRVQDAQRNAVSSCARTVIGHKSMQGKSTVELKSIIKDDLDKLPSYARHGALFTRIRETHFKDGIAWSRAKIAMKDPEIFRKETITEKINTIFSAKHSHLIVDIESHGGNNAHFC